MKTCTKCIQPQPLTAFSKDGTGLRAECKLCASKKRKDHYAEHKEEVKSRSRAFYEIHRDTILSKLREGRPARIADTKTREDKLQYFRDRYAANREKMKAEAFANARRNPEMVKARYANYRARELNAPGKCSTDQLRARFDFYGNSCAYCGAPAKSADHVIPLSRGGSNWPANIRPACKSCNSSKHDRKLSEWRGPQQHAA